MKRILISLSCGLAIGLAATTATASNAKDFLVDSTQDLADLCAVSTDDPDYRAALHFCHGFMVGAYHYHAVTEGVQNPNYFCAPEPAPTRNEIVDAFVKWV